MECMISWALTIFCSKGGGKNQKNECKSVDDKEDLTCYGAINYVLPKGADAKETNKVKMFYGGRWQKFCHLSLLSYNNFNRL